MSHDNSEGSPPGGPQYPERRQFLGRAAAVAAAAAGLPTLLAACESGAPTGPASASAGGAVAGGSQPRFSLAGGPNFGNTAHKMVAGTIGSAPDVKVPALEKGITTTYLQRIVTDSDRTGTGLATVVRKLLKGPDGSTVQIVVQNSLGRAWPARSIAKQSDLVYAMKDAMATNPNHAGVLRESLNAGCHIVSISNCAIVQFPDSVASDIYGNHNDIFSRGLCDVFNASVGGYRIAATTRDPKRC
jgi:hypothetical protein